MTTLTTTPVRDTFAAYRTRAELVRAHSTPATPATATALVWSATLDGWVCTLRAGAECHSVRIPLAPPDHVHLCSTCDPHVHTCTC